MYIEQTLQTYLDDLASSKSTPGGGSATAGRGAMAAALAAMVCQLTLGKEKYADVQGGNYRVAQPGREQRQRFQELLAADIAAYGKFSACLKLPRETEDQRLLRADAPPVVSDRSRAGAFGNEQTGGTRRENLWTRG